MIKSEIIFFLIDRKPVPEIERVLLLVDIDRSTLELTYIELKTYSSQMIIVHY